MDPPEDYPHMFDTMVSTNDGAIINPSNTGHEKASCNDGCNDKNMFGSDELSDGEHPVFEEMKLDSTPVQNEYQGPYAHNSDEKIKMSTEAVFVLSSVMKSSLERSGSLQKLREDEQLLTRSLIGNDLAV